MRNIFYFLQKYHHWFLFVLLEVVSLVLLFQFNSYQGSVWFTSANVVAGKVYECTSAIEKFFSLTAVNEGLTRRNIELEQEVALLHDRLLTMGADTTSIPAMKDGILAGVDMIPAHVVSNSVDKTDNFLTIDRGEADGIRRDMGVICGNGVVGIVYYTSAHYSVVIPVLSSHSNISCSIQGREYFGYLHWRGGSPTIAYLDNVPRHAHFKLYDKVITSGFSSVFPKGILVGKILHVHNSPDGLSYRMEVQLSVDFTKVRDVCVINDRNARERLEVMRAAQDSIKVNDKETGL